jgi:hypothetical protein
MGDDSQSTNEGIVEMKRSQKKTLASTFISYAYESMRRKRETNR